MTEEVPESQTEEVDEVRTINPFKIVHRGEDTVTGDDNIIFSDFSPRVLPADVPDEVEPAPKAESVPEPAPSSESTETSAQKKSENPVPAPAAEGDGLPSPSVPGKPSSSSGQKSG